jgi:hypothetical protein
MSENNSTALPKQIKVPQTRAIKEIVPGDVWRQKFFPYKPTGFTAKSQELERGEDDVPPLIDANVQKEGLLAFLNNPTLPMTYIVTGDEGMAEYFAAFLIQAHLERVGQAANVEWDRMYNTFTNRLFKTYGERPNPESDPTMIVLSDLSPLSSDTALGKTRDILSRFSEVPRIVIAAKEDPISFAATRLYAKSINAIAYFQNPLIKSIEVF